jgi:3-deoxy-D-manno-octulosonic-acid transferase
LSRARLLYTLLLYLAFPYIVARLAWRSLSQRGYLANLGERFGHYPPAPTEPVLWVHAVSVGETRAAEPLVRALAERHPGHRILLTHMTPTGRATGEALYGATVSRCYLPYDYPGAVRRFLAHFRPRAGLLMDTEIWPNLIHACRERGIPLTLVNARLSEKSYSGYRRFAGLARECFSALAGVAAQSGDDARRLAALGARAPLVTGGVKFDIAPPAPQLELGLQWRRGFGGRPVLLAASTREGEEPLVLDALASMDVPGLLTIIVPRHPQRFDEVARLLEARGLRYRRRSEGGEIAADTRALLGDSMGEMYAYYAACDVAFIGGSLVPTGGQNLIEACAVGRPVLIGPSTYNFSEAAELALRAGAAVQVKDAKSLAREAGRLLRDPAAARRMGEAGLAFCAAHRGATERILELIEVKDAGGSGIGDRG